MYARWSDRLGAIPNRNKQQTKVIATPVAWKGEAIFKRFSYKSINDSGLIKEGI